VAGFTGLAQANAGGNVQGLAALIFTKYLWAFELTGALLITATLAAMVLAHRERFDRRKSQRELAQERFQPGGDPPPRRPPPVPVPATTPSTFRVGFPTVQTLSCRSAPSFNDGPWTERPTMP